MSVQQEIRPQHANAVSEKPRMSPWSWVVWIVVAAGIGLIIYLSVRSPQGKDGKGPGILFDSVSQDHSWLSKMLFSPSTVGQKIFVMFLAIVVFVVVMGLILWLVDRPKVPNGVLVAGFIGPVVIALGGGLLWTGITTIINSFRGASGSGDPAGWVGFANYANVFSGPNTKMLINTVVWIIVVPILACLIGLVYATLVDRTRFEAAAKALVFLPTAISMVAASVIWKYVYFQPTNSGHGQVGLLNAAVQAVGGKPQNWIVLYPQGTIAMIIVMIWIQAGFAMTVLSAAIKAVPDDIVEAARIDGATGMRLFWSITVPTIRPTLVVVLTTVAIASLKTFDIVNVMGGNLPNNNIVANAFYNQMAVGQPGKAGAFAVIIFIIVTPVILFNVRQMRKADSIR